MRSRSSSEPETTKQEVSLPLTDEQNNRCQAKCDAQEEEMLFFHADDRRNQPTLYRQPHEFKELRCAKVVSSTGQVGRGGCKKQATTVFKKPTVAAFHVPWPEVIDGEFLSAK
jgi:hypothetical protein